MERIIVRVSALVPGVLATACTLIAVGILWGSTFPAMVRRASLPEVRESERFREVPEPKSEIPEDDTSVVRTRRETWAMMQAQLSFICDDGWVKPVIKEGVHVRWVGRALATLPIPFMESVNGSEDSHPPLYQVLVKRDDSYVFPAFSNRAFPAGSTVEVAEYDYKACMVGYRGTPVCIIVDW